MKLRAWWKSWKFWPGPETVVFSGPLNPGFRLLRNITLRIEPHQGKVVVWWDEVAEFGTGESVELALLDFGDVIQSCYVFIETVPGAVDPKISQLVRLHVARIPESERKA